ncbi:immunoglobulin I-set domain protein [Ancylostoma duodenale]|uniref:Immunoglobulin I-set domain protein n=1 Tax=Ancylostoma duodenale TaxID=51022 RepID=A0A0C2C7W5_9BILA|nr:immunoglobulin I-set domain protein [Ancylostoma duodenale]
MIRASRERRFNKQIRASLSTNPGVRVEGTLGRELSEVAGESIGDSDKYKVHDGLLVIESLSEHDSGAYKCVASNAVGNASQIAELKVLRKSLL